MGPLALPFNGVCVRGDEGGVAEAWGRGHGLLASGHFPWLEWRCRPGAKLLEGWGHGLIGLVMAHQGLGCWGRGSQEDSQMALPLIVVGGRAIWGGLGWGRNYRRLASQLHSYWG